MDHKIFYETDGDGGNCGKRWPVCSCGWVGVKVPNYEDYQYAQNKRDADQHIRDMRRAPASN